MVIKLYLLNFKNPCVHYPAILHYSPSHRRISEYRTNFPYLVLSTLLRLDFIPRNLIINSSKLQNPKTQPAWLTSHNLCVESISRPTSPPRKLYRTELVNSGFLNLILISNKILVQVIKLLIDETLKRQSSIAFKRKLIKFRKSITTEKNLSNHRMSGDSFMSF